MNGILYWLARALLGLLGLFPLLWVARLGRWIGALFYWLDGRHRRVVLDNLHRVFGAGKTPHELRCLAHENFRRIGENFACAAKTATMTNAEIQQCLVFAGQEKLNSFRRQTSRRSCVVAIGHFGNFELYARAPILFPEFQSATTYRGLRQPGLNRLMQNLREKSGCLYFERRSDAAALRTAMQQKCIMLGLLVDQHAGDRGLPVPFFGQNCSTSAAPALFALRYDCPLFTSICYRIAPGRWRIEIGDEIPTHANGKPRTLEEITWDINRAFEGAILQDPANWFWVHRRWKPVKRKPARPHPQPQPADA
jgi:lauroyl/myristoyl acyltransferase